MGGEEGRIGGEDEMPVLDRGGGRKGKGEEGGRRRERGKEKFTVVGVGVFYRLLWFFVFLKSFFIPR